MFDLKPNTYIPDKYDFYLKLIDISLENSNQFRKDAFLLKNNLSFGHAYSMAVLGFEELAKVWFAFGLFIGQYTESDEIGSKITSDHLAKQMHNWYFISGYLIGDWYQKSEHKNEIDILHKQMQKGKITQDYYLKKFFGFVEEEADTSTLARNVVEFMEVAEKLDKNPSLLNRKRNEGFYIDFDLTKRRILSTPTKFTLENLTFLETFDGFYKNTEEFMLSVKENLQRKSVQEYIKNAREFFKFIRQNLPDAEY